jgi:hypothetical protein
VVKQKPLDAFPPRYVASDDAQGSLTYLI